MKWKDRCDAKMKGDDCIQRSLTGALFGKFLSIRFGQSVNDVQRRLLYVHTTLLPRLLLGILSVQVKVTGTFRNEALSCNDVGL